MTISMQEYFDITINHLSNQKYQSHSPLESTCVYLAPDGNKCAVGIHIPDGHEAQNAILTVTNLAFKYPDLAGIAWPDSEWGLRLARELQKLHDYSQYRVSPNYGGINHEGEKLARKIADNFNLTYTPPENR